MTSEEQTGGTAKESPPETSAETADTGQETAQETTTPGAEIPPEPPPPEGEAPPGQQAPADAAIDYEDKFLRLTAEFDNFKKRMHKEQSQSLKYAQMPLLRDLTGVMDNLERAIDHARESKDAEHEAFVAGLEMVTKQISDIFERFGMTRIEAVGKPFDPTRHEAMSVVETSDAPENTVISEMQTGYILHGRIVRPAMVVVAKAPPAPAAGQVKNEGVVEEL